MAVEALVWDQLVGLNIDQDIFTASPNNTVNCVQIAAIGSGANIGLALSPKGTGYISAQVPDGTATGGNARGANAVDLHTKRTTAGAVASGECSALIGGQQSSASGINSVAVGGNGNAASGLNAVCVGGNGGVASGAGAVSLGRGTASGAGAISGGQDCISSGNQSVTLGVSNVASAEGAMSTGRYSRAHRLGMKSHASTAFVTAGDSQFFIQTAACKTTSATPAEVFLNQQFGNLPIGLLSNSIIHAVVNIVGAKSDGSAVASYLRQVTIKRVANATSLVGTVNTIGVDEAAGTSIAITANDANDSLKIEVTGIASETWRWSASIYGTELGFGT